MYYIINIETGMYFGGYRANYERDDVNWRKKPRIYSTKGGAKLSAAWFLTIYQWSLVPYEKRAVLADIESVQYLKDYPKSTTGLSHEWSQRRAMFRYWDTIKHKSLEELLPPHLELRTITL